MSRTVTEEAAVANTLLTFDQTISAIPAHKPPRGNTQLIIVAYNEQAGSIEDLYMSAGGVKLEGDLSMAVVDALDSIKGKSTNIREWQRLGGSIHHLTALLARHLSRSLAPVGVRNIVAVIPNRENEPLPPLVFDNNLLYQGKLAEIAERITLLCRSIPSRL